MRSFLRFRAQMNSENVAVLPTWPMLLKWLHSILLLCITFQLVTGLSGWIAGSFPLFSWHVCVGKILIVALVMQWAWLLGNTEGRHILGYLFPFYPKGLKAVSQDIALLVHRTLPAPGVCPGLPGLMHGIFLLTSTIVAFSGVLLYGTFQNWWSVFPTVSLLVILRLGAAILAVQWLGHVGMALLHAVIGEPLWKIFYLLHNKVRK
jgi:hypothetical protein